jgi:protein-tyrosine phosphatase
VTAPDPTRILFLCTGNATRSVLGGAALAQRRPDLNVSTAGTLVIEGLPMSFRTKAGFDAIDLTAPQHRSRQATHAILLAHDLVVAMAPEHVQWVRREHPDIASRTATLKRLCRELAPGEQPLTERVAALQLEAVVLEPWEEVVDPGGGEVDHYVACALEVNELVDDLVHRL